MSFVSRLRVAIRKYLYFQKLIAKLGPGYYGCNDRQSSCTRRKAQPRLGCPDCEYTIQSKHFRDELDNELKHLKRGTWLGGHRWPSKKLIPLVVEVGATAGSREGVDPMWPVSTALFVGIYREEVAKMRAIDDWNLSQTNATERAEMNASKVEAIASQKTLNLVKPREDENDVCYT